MEYDKEHIEIINNYVETFVDDWRCSFDYEDGSTAPFSSVALEVSIPEWRR